MYLYGLGIGSIIMVNTNTIISIVSSVGPGVLAIFRIYSINIDLL